MMVVDTMKSFGKTGQETQELLESVGITLNKNAIPDDPLPPFKASGVRLGTPPATTRGMGEPEMRKIAEWIVAACREETPLETIGAGVRELCRAFPSPSGMVE